MKTIKLYFIFLFLVISLNMIGQNKNDKLEYEKSRVQNELNFALKKSNDNGNIANNLIIIKDSLTAIKIVEPILFGIYGKKNIVKQKPYKTFFIDSYWIVEGTLTKGFRGGIFQIIINSKNSKVIKISHGK